MVEDSYKHKGMRRRLIQKLREKGINSERVLEAMGNIPRHIFFENAFLEHAYQDKAFPIGHGQTISQPYTVAFQTQLLNISPGDKVLEIGTGSGYQAMVLHDLGANLYTIEYQKPLYERTKNFLPQLGYKIHFFQGDGSKGLKAHAPFDKIIVTAGAPTVPNSLIEQLRIGGCLVIPVGDNTTQQMLRLTKVSDRKISKEVFSNFSFVPLKGEEGWR
ncbi:protein-L-isoaspartate(D-aspartate) O-methyltransferase [Marivirga arenosa]|uniref:Protein-L-isoaspartate O-methyltransferase n=2 Tax=Marivirga arenosa TaxID=3059076 RepID=A0AA51N820_9BACT|nr:MULTISPECIES: protein-L-isoaspartate(D-aspartate) O-methyltransferase [unclassified Marivirga]WKK79536.2 protein-L-isoaspartate(D-aspartate) O-methyltransferase [Marivirga sp. BKB1-2]WMN06225.1 protein-L-isoaspartate(D-aspartate) O-methyltransferase [Marivirga sp. ABR2-2]